MVLNANDSNAVVTKYTWGLDLSGSIHGAGGVGGLLACEETEDSDYEGEYWFFHDANGNVSQIVESDWYGDLVAHYEYDPYGNCIVIDDVDQSGYANDNPFRFSTKWLDTELAAGSQTGAIGETGVYYYGYRYYSPTLGRWINEDPIEEQGGLNLYALVHNNAIGSVDLIGLGEYKIGSEAPKNSYAPDIAASKANYDIWSPTLSDYAWIAGQGVLVRAAIAGGKIRGMANAADFLAHFKNNVGTNKSANVKELIKNDSNAQNRFNDEINDTLAFVEQNSGALGEGIVTKDDYQINAVDTDWVYTLGTYRHWSQGTDITCEDGTYSMTFTFFIRDNYDWDITSTLGAGTLPWGGSVLYDANMAKLHRFGAMQEFEVDGSYTVTVTWKEGQRLGSGAQVKGPRR